MILGPSSLFIWRLVDVSWFSSLYKRCVFSRGTFFSLKLSLHLLSFLSCIDSREIAFGVFLIMILGPSSLFIWRLVDVSWFSSLYKRCVFSRGTFFSLKPSLYLLSFLSCIDSCEKAFGVFLIMIHGPSSLFIWRLVDVSWFSSLYKRCVFSRGTFFSLKPSLYLLSLLSCIDSREKAFRVFLIMIHGPSSLFIWRLVDVSWFSSLYKRCVFSRGTFFSLKPSLYLLSFLSCIDSREKAFRVFLIMIHGPSSLFIWRLVDVSWFSSFYKRCVFSRGTSFSLKPSLYLLSFLSCIDSREKAFGVFLIMIHGPSSLFIWRLVDVSWFSSFYKRCVFSRGTFFSLKLSLYLLSFLSWIDSREKAFRVFLIMIHGPSSLFIWRLVDVSWFSSLYKRCVFSSGTFFSLKLSLYLLSFLSCIDSREKAFGVFLIMIHGPSSLFIWRLVDVSWFSSFYKRCVFSRGTFFFWNFRSISSHSWVELILVRKPLECFWLWSMVLLAYLSDDSLMWADFQVYIKDASFREEHFSHWNLRSISSHSWVVLILVRKPLECFWLWSMVLLAYLSDDSLMWADFQVYIKDASFRVEHFSHWNFRSISSHSWVVLILVRKPLECFWLWSMVLLAYLSDDSLMWADFQVFIKDASFREEHFSHWNFRSISFHSWVVLILVRKPLEYFWLWTLVLLAYLSDDSLMWADFQVYIKDASFREEHFSHWNFRSISSHSWVVLILVR